MGEDFNGLNNVMGTDASLFEQLIGGARARHRLDGQFHDFGQWAIKLGEYLQHGIAESAFGPMVFNNHNFASGFLCRRYNGLLVQRLDGVGIDNANVDTLALQLVISFECLVESDSGSHYRGLVFIGLAYYLAAADHKFLVSTIEDWRCFASGAHVDNTIMFRHLRYELGSLVAIAGIKDGTAKHGSEHCK